MPVEFHPYKNTKAEIDNIQIKEGQLLFSTDEKKIYLDNSDTERIQVGGGESSGGSSESGPVIDFQSYGPTVTFSEEKTYKAGDIVVGNYPIKAHSNTLIPTREPASDEILEVVNMALCICRVESSKGPWAETFKNFYPVNAYNSLHTAIKNYNSNLRYNVGDLVLMNQKQIYLCLAVYPTKEPGTDASSWYEITNNGSSTSGATINNWAAATAYKVGDLVINGTTLYQCTIDHTSEQTFNETESANWTSLSGAKGDKGDKGEDGIDGTNGVSPTISTTAKEDNSGTTITITDVNGTKSFEVLNGIDGVNGIDGTNGENGVSPIATITSTDTGATITITDKNGTTTADISNGINGITPHIDATNKHWFIGETDTGIIAEGITTVQTTSVKYTGTLTVDGWTGDTAPFIQTVNIAGITSELSPIVDLIISDDVDTGLKENNQWGCVTKAITNDGSISFYCYETKPDVELNIVIEVI